MAPIMDNRQRAIQFWSLLVLAARTNTVLSYGMVEKMTGLPKQAQGDPLGYVLYYCMKNNLPLLSSLDVSQEDGQPSFDQIYTHVDIEAEHRRCFVYDWLEHGVPSLEKLDEAHAIGRKLIEDYIAKKAAAKKAAAVVA